MGIRKFHSLIVNTIGPGIGLLLLSTYVYPGDVFTKKMIRSSVGGCLEIDKSTELSSRVFDVITSTSCDGEDQMWESTGKGANDAKQIRNSEDFCLASSRVSNRVSNIVAETCVDESIPIQQKWSLEFDGTIRNGDDCLEADNTNVNPNIVTRNVTSKSCIAQLPEQHWQIWERTKDAAILGFNNKRMPENSTDKLTVEQCMTACEIETDFICKSFDYHKDTEKCDLSVQRGTSSFILPLFKAQQELFGLSILKKDFDGNPYDHYTLSSFRNSVDAGNPSWRKTPNSWISGHNKKRLPENSTNSLTVNECMNKCEIETNFICKSFDYHKKTGKCDLSDQNDASQDLSKGDGTDSLYDHYSLRKPKISSSEWHKTQNAAIRGHNTRTLDDKTVEECMSECKDEQDFICKSFDYDKKYKKCDLSDHNSVTKTLSNTASIDIADNIRSYDHYTRIDDNVFFPHGWSKTPNAAIRGHNKKTLDNVTVQQCKSECENATNATFDCKSFDYYKDQNKCDLSDQDNTTQKLISAERYDHYTRSARSLFTMAIISDPQIGYCANDNCKDQMKSKNEEPFDASKRVNKDHSASLTKLKAESINFKGVIVNGDLTHTMEDDELDLYRELYANKFRVFEGLGNHDYQNYVKGDSKWCADVGIAISKHYCAKEMVDYIANGLVDYPIRSFDWSTDKWVRKGSLVYFWDIGNYRFIQLHNYPDYSVSFDVYMSNRLGTEEYKVDRGWDTFREILGREDSNNKNIILNMHSSGHVADDSMERDGLNKLRDILTGDNRIKGIFVGHLHSLAGFYRDIVLGDGSTVPLFFGGAAETNLYTKVEFFEKKYYVHVVNSLNGKVEYVGEPKQVKW